MKRYDHTHTRSENSNSTTIDRRCGYAGNGVSRAGIVVTLAKGKQNVSTCIFDVVMSCACALEPRIYNDCGNWSGPSTGLDTWEEECEELFPVNLLGGSRFLHLTVLCFFPCMTPKVLHYQVNSKDDNA